MTNWAYSDTIRLPGETSLEIAEMVLASVREIAAATFNCERRTIEFSVASDTLQDSDGGDGDLWTVAMAVNEIGAMLASHGIDFDPSREKVTQG